MQTLALLLTVLLLGVGLALNTAVLIFFLVRTVRAVLPVRSFALPQDVMLPNPQS